MGAPVHHFHHSRSSMSDVTTVKSILAMKDRWWPLVKLLAAAGRSRTGGEISHSSLKHFLIRVFGG